MGLKINVIVSKCEHQNKLVAPWWLLLVGDRPLYKLEFGVDAAGWRTTIRDKKETGKKKPV